MTQRNISVVTGSRADYGLLFPILKKIKSSNHLKLQLLVTTAHLSSEFGNTFKEIEKDGFHINERIENFFESDTQESIAKSAGLATMLLAESFKRLMPDIVLILGDRFEAHAAATAAMLMKIPIAHIHGGEITEGAIDEQIRHSITKMSNLHFCSTEIYRQRIIQMGEDPCRVFNSGAPGIDNIKNLKLLSKNDLEKKINWNFSRQTALFTFHPVTLSNDDLLTDLSNILLCIEKSSISVLFTYANADSGGQIINKNIEKFSAKNPRRFKVVKNLGQINYLSAMRHVDLLIGNSSSGIIEAASYSKPVINIGDRQSGRVKSKNIIDASISNLSNSIDLALSLNFKDKCQNINNAYGDGNASSIIVNELIKQPLSVKKFFKDI
jgi:UDP-hydrolysing UDP-N-acetyl-D-glucosamine 2-epimerase